VRADSRRLRDELMARVAKELELRQPGRYVSRIEALSDTAAWARSKARGSAIILAILSVFVLTVVMLGLFGFAMFTVSRRTRQIGILRALGCRRADVMRHYLLESWVILSAGVVVGTLLTLAAGLEISLYLQLPRLPAGYLVAGIATLWLSGTLAVLLPAIRASRVSPATATRMT
jgi:putative ABC transport system permease protein